MCEKKDNDKSTLVDELNIKVTSWLHSSFNFISINILNKLTDNNLIEYMYFGETSDYLLKYLDDCDEVILILDYLQNNSFDNEDDIISSYQSFNGTIKESFIACVSDDWDDFCSFVLDEYDNDIKEFIFEQNEDEFPAHYTCFEFRDAYFNEQEEILYKAVNLGMFVIEGVEDLNRLLFIPHSDSNFICKHLTPFYLELFPSEKEKYGHLDLNCD